MCTALGADALKHRVLTLLDERPADAERCRVLRGGCYGLCELSANVVVRRHAAKGRRPDPEVDRLSLTEKKNETVYSRVEPRHIARILGAHLDEDGEAGELTRQAREAEVAPPSKLAERLRKLRRRRERGDG